MLPQTIWIRRGSTVCMSRWEWMWTKSKQLYLLQKDAKHIYRGKLKKSLEITLQMLVKTSFWQADACIRNRFRCVLISHHLTIQSIQSVPFCLILYCQCRGSHTSFNLSLIERTVDIIILSPFETSVILVIFNVEIPVLPCPCHIVPVIPVSHVGVDSSINWKFWLLLNRDVGACNIQSSMCSPFVWWRMSLCCKGL